jgi:hypothetical protein
MRQRGRHLFAPRASAEDVAALDLAAAAAARSLMLLPQDPPMTPADESVFLLHTAAEVEHALLAQYLYAAYSLDAVTTPQSLWRETIIGIAREEMAHLMSVQNVLLGLGGPLNFEREDFPFRRDLYPFPLSLEPFSVKTAAKYVLAEMPDADQVPEGIGFDLERLRQDAGITDPENVINRVGPLYERLATLLEGLPEADFHRDSLPWQATPQEWSATALGLILRVVDSRDAAVALLRDIGTQGEGPEEPVGGTPSHFRRFLTIYLEAREWQVGGGAAMALPTDPNTRDRDAPGYLAAEEARLWGELLNIRYRILLAQFAHCLALRRDRVPDKPRRDRLRRWCHQEMARIVPELAGRLSQVPQHDPPQTVRGQIRLAGPPFELPVSLGLPEREVDRWRHHGLLIEASRAIAERLAGTTSEAALLDELAAWDGGRRAFIETTVAELLAAA